MLPIPCSGQQQKIIGLHAFTAKARSVHSSTQPAPPRAVSIDLNTVHVALATHQPIRDEPGRPAPTRYARGTRVKASKPTTFGIWGKTADFLTLVGPADDQIHFYTFFERPHSRWDQATAESSLQVPRAHRREKSSRPRCTYIMEAMRLQPPV